ncbi:MAG TPA: MarR family transcriptional regulator [Solirubrobacteraceae bacterium]|jgi:hypothetical protein
MDTTPLSARATAKVLGTSTPRVLRALASLGVVVRKGRRVQLTATQVEQLRARLGETPPIAGLSRTEAVVAATLARAPLGLASQRAVARRAGVSPTAAGRAIRSLREKRLIGIEGEVLPGSRPRRVALIRADYTSPAWQRVAGDLARVKPPRAKRSDGRTADARNPAPRVPARLDYLFWNTAASQKDTRRAGGYVARRLLQAADPEGLAWGAENLRPIDWDHAAAARGIAPQVRSLARNLAESAR